MGSGSSKSAKTTDEKDTARPTDLTSMDRRRRFSVEVVMLVRSTFRSSFGESFSDKWGFYIDRHMSRVIRDFGYWVDYPAGGHTFRHSSAVYATVISDDGHLLFTGDFAGTMVVWNMVDHRMMKEWLGHDESVLGLAFKHGSLVSCDRHGIIKLWDTLRDYQLVHTLKGHTSSVKVVSFNDKGTQILSSSADNSIRIWSVKTGECIRVMEGHSDRLTSSVFVGKSIVSAAYDKSLKVWNSSNGNEIQSVMEGIDDKIYDVSVNCDSSIIACAFDGGFSLFSWPEMKFIRQNKFPTMHVTFHPIHPHILAVDDTSEKSIRIYNINDDNYIRNFRGHSMWIYGFCFSPDGTRLVSVASDKTALVYDTSSV